MQYKTEDQLSRAICRRCETIERKKIYRRTVHLLLDLCMDFNTNCFEIVKGKYIHPALQGTCDLMKDFEGLEVPLKISYQSEIRLEQDTRLEIRWKDELVFVVWGCTGADPHHYPRGEHLIVEKYIPGTWEKLLDVAELVKFQQRKKDSQKKEEKVRIARNRERKCSRPPTEFFMQRARELGIKC